MPISTVLVVGATGSIGRLVVEEAVPQGYRTRALVRDPTRARQLPRSTESTPSCSPSGSHSGKADAERVDYGGVRNVLRAVGSRTVRVALMTARRVGVGKHVLLADLRQNNADAAAEVLGNAGYEVSVATVDVSSREAVHALVETATGLGP